jgi:hypothetical protein
MAKPSGIVKGRECTGWSVCLEQLEVSREDVYERKLYFDEDEKQVILCSEIKQTGGSKDKKPLKQNTTYGDLLLARGILFGNSSVIRKSSQESISRGES